MDVINKAKNLKNSRVKIKTKPFGNISISAREMIHFPEGIFAFEHLKKYVLLNTKKNTCFKWLQNIEEPHIAFLVADPLEFASDYDPQISAQSLAMIGIEKHKEMNIYCIITVPANEPEKMTINLQGPLVVNPQKMIACQFVSESDQYSVREPLLELIKKTKMM